MAYLLKHDSVLGTLDEWPLRQRLAFANLCAALSVQYVGGSLAAPGWGDIIDWLGRIRAKAADGSSHAAELAKAQNSLTLSLPGYWETGAGVQQLSGWATGLTSLGRLTGVLCLQNASPDGLPQEQVSFIEALSGTAAIASRCFPSR